MNTAPLPALRQTQRAYVSSPPILVPSSDQKRVIATSACKADTPRYLITLDVGIGDAVALGLSAIEQIVQHDQAAWGTIDVLCKPLQGQVFAHDPRVNRVITTDIIFFPGLRPTQWLQCICFDQQQTDLLDFLRERHYEAVFLSIAAPGLYYRLGARLMYPSLREMTRDFFALRRLQDAPVSKVARQMVDHYFGQAAPHASLPDEPLLYLSTKEILKAQVMLATMRARACIAAETARVVLVAADTATDETRPPTHLLAESLTEALQRRPELIVAVLPGYSTDAAERLVAALVPNFAGRVFALPAEPHPTLLETAALIDQADIFLTGDTGVMHLAAARKALPEADVRSNEADAPKNAVKIIVLFGGTNPAFFGYRKRTTILGQGRKEQKAIKPGLFKAGFNTRGRDFFDHIAPLDIADAILKTNR
jgi:ADP-heptose:LPS heptosyltransferase